MVLRSLDWFKSLRKRSALAIPKAPLSQSPASHGERRSRCVRRPVGLPGAAFVRRLFLSFFVADNALTGRCALRLRLWHPGLSSVFSTHVLRAFKIVLFRHYDVLRVLWVTDGFELAVQQRSHLESDRVSTDQTLRGGPLFLRMIAEYFQEQSRSERISLMLADAGRPRQGLLATLLGFAASVFAAVGVVVQLQGCFEYRLGGWHHQPPATVSRA